MFHICYGIYLHVYLHESHAILMVFNALHEMWILLS